MLHANFQDHRTSGSGEEDFQSFYHIWAWLESCGHLGHVTWVIYINLIGSITGFFLS